MTACHKKNLESRSEVIRSHKYCGTNRYLVLEFIQAANNNFRSILLRFRAILCSEHLLLPYPTPFPAEIRDVRPSFEVNPWC